MHCQIDNFVVCAKNSPLPHTHVYGRIRNICYYFLLGKEKSTPLLDYIKEKADKKRQDREQRRESRKKREDERKKAREDERKRRKEKKEQELREKEMRDRDKKEKTLGKSGSVRQQHKSFEPDKNRTEKYERSSKYHRDELSHEPTETSGRRGSRGGKGSRYQNDEIKYPPSKNERSINSSSSNRGTSKPERDRVEKEKPVSTVKGNNDANMEQEECNKSESKYSSKSSSSRNKDDRRTKEEPKEERATKSREGKQGLWIFLGMPTLNFNTQTLPML